MTPGESASINTQDRESVLSTYQAGLFEEFPTVIDHTFSSAVRIQLDETSWIEYVPMWISGSESLFKDLLRCAPWQLRTRWMYTQDVIEPRLTAQYSHVSQAPESIMSEITASLARRYASLYTSLWMNLYRSHHDSTAWHGDRIGRVTPDCIVPVLSLGATRRFLIQPSEGGKSLTFHPASGDLIVMGGRCQVDWRHCVPKQATASGPRISINFKPSTNSTQS
ncbi:MAG: alpha-ketoglutarate-dependent dioxygenase AlkB [Acidimicrobiales bacterium]